MKTGKLFIKPAQSYQNRKDGESYVPVSFFKNTRISGGSENDQIKQAKKHQVDIQNTSKNLYQHARFLFKALNKISEYLYLWCFLYNQFFSRP